MDEFAEPLGMRVSIRKGENLERRSRHARAVPDRKILEALGEPLDPSPVSPARGTPADWGEFGEGTVVGHPVLTTRVRDRSRREKRPPHQAVGCSSPFQS